MPGSMHDIKREIGLHCLHCGQSQLPPARDQLHNWTCTYCFSGFISVAMLTNLIPRELVTKLATRAPHPRWGRKCPKCHLHMEISMLVDGDTRADFDVCHPCRLLWFDAGGIVKILKLRDPQEMIEHFARATKYIPQNTPSEPRGIHAKATVEEVKPSYFDAKNLLKVLCASGLLGGVLAALGKGGGSIVEFAAVGGLAYILSLLPYREMLFPKDRWRSPLGKIVWTVVGIVGLVNVVLVWDFFYASFRQVAAGGKGGRLAGTLFGALSQFLGSPTFLAFIAAASVGVLWAIVEEPKQKSPRQL